MSTPLAERLRPTTLEHYVGQRHLLGPGKALRRLIEAGAVPSMILWGPPGVGKTSLAYLIARRADRPFQSLSAVSAGVKEVREVIARAQRQGSVVLFIDEIHRFNKSQQDALLGAVEKGWITLVGATTENPSFEVNGALLSRCQVLTLRPLAREDLLELTDLALRADDRMRALQPTLAAPDTLLRLAGGDARRLLNLLELAAEAAPPAPDGTRPLTDALLVEVAQRKVPGYDKKGEQHYDVVSAFIKSLRGSDPNAAVYWLARLIEGGEDVKFIARRMLILASEDIGNANPTAMILANNCFQAVAVVGYPEAEIVLSQTAVYLAMSAKSNASYVAIKQARRRVAETGDLPVPLPLRNAPTKLMKQEGYGKGYRYAHDFPGHFAPMHFLPDALRGMRFYQPADNPREREFLQKLRALWKEYYDY